MPTTNKPQEPRKRPCPNCGTLQPLVAHPTDAGRVIMICTCNQAGPVLETDAPGFETEQETTK